MSKPIAPRPMANPMHVLVVEDYRPYARAVQKVLNRRFGFDVTVMCNGEDALSYFADSRPDLLLIDMELPGMSGYETLRSIRSCKNGEGVPTIVVSGCADIEYVEAMARLGVKGYVQKESALDELPELMRAIFA